MKVHVLATLLLSFALNGLPLHGGESDQYLINSRILLISQSSGTGAGATPVLSWTTHTQTLYEEKQARVGDERRGSVLVLSGPTAIHREDKAKTRLLKMEKDQFELSVGEEDGDDIRVLSAPQMLVLDGKEGMIQITSGPHQYFEKLPNGDYQLKTLSEDNWTGIELRLQVQGDKRNVKMVLQYQSVLRRAQLDEVALDVGKPELEKYTVEIDALPFADNEWMALLSPAKNGKKLLIGVKISKVVAKPADPTGK